MSTPVLDVRRGDDRTFQRIDGVHSRFSFPFAGNFDLTRSAHGALLVHNDDVVDPFVSFDPHRHAETEIVTWVVDGEVEHSDSAGHTGRLRAGSMQRMTAGTGVVHSERNPSSSARLRVVQMWVAPDAPDKEPSYAERDLDDALAGGEVVTALSGLPDEEPGLGIGNRWVALDVCRPRAGHEVRVAAAPTHHLYVTRGEVEVRTGGGDKDGDKGWVRLGEGDALRATDAGPLVVRRVGDGMGDGDSAGADENAAEFLVWRMHAHF